MVNFEPALAKEKFNTLSHSLGAICALIGTLFLVIQAENIMDKFVASVFGICSVIVFTFSGVYHFKKKKDDEISVWRKIDHFGIFFTIAGTFTPLCYLYTEGAMRLGIIIAQWVFVVLGMLFKIKFMDAPRWMSLGIYVLMGLMAVVPLGQLLQGLANTGPSAMAFFWTALISIIMGITVYGSKKPNPLPETFGFHGIWHILVMISQLFLFLLMFEIF